MLNILSSTKRGKKKMYLGSSVYLKSIYPNNQITYLPNGNGLMLVKLELCPEQSIKKICGIPSEQLNRKLDHNQLSCPPYKSHCLWYQTEKPIPNKKARSIVKWLTRQKKCSNNQRENN